MVTQVRCGEGTHVMVLDAGTLHDSLRQPVLGSIGFLNEVMSRYPDAISFAPGAPHPSFLLDLDVPRYVERYVDHLQQNRGMSARRARLLLHEYGPSKGIIGDVIARSLAIDHAIDVSAASVVVTVGAQEAMLLLLRVLCRDPDDLVAVSTPCFVGVVGAATLLGLDVVPITDTERGPDVDQLRSVCAAARARGKRIRVCYVAPDYANPSGTTADLGVRQALLALAESEDFLILEDNTYGFTAPVEESLPPLKALDRSGRVAHVGTFAKVCLPGARVGFIVADQNVRRADGTAGLLADELAVAKSVVTVNTPPICQAAIAGMILEHGGSLSALGAVKARRYRGNLAVLLAALDRFLDIPDVSWTRPAGGFFVRLRVPVAVDAELLELSASRYGVLWTPMSAFCLDGGGSHELRLSCSYLDPEHIDRGVERLARMLGDVIVSAGTTR